MDIREAAKKYLKKILIGSAIKALPYHHNLSIYVFGHDNSSINKILMIWDYLTYIRFLSFIFFTDLKAISYFLVMYAPDFSPEPAGRERRAL